MSARLAPFPCTLLRDYPPEDLWQGYLVFGQVQPDGRIYLSEYCERDGARIGAAFEANAREGFHFSIDQPETASHQVRRLGDVKLPVDPVMVDN